jgi:hypothetical protein
MMKKLLTFCTIVLSVVMMTACKSESAVVQTAQVEGHYTYQHGWNYDVEEGHIDVHETGTMDFFADGSALDSARQVYKVSLNDGGTVMWVFNYVSPSKWHVEGEDFFFSGEEKTFRMEFLDTTHDGCDESQTTELAERILKGVRGSIGRETKFHLDELTPSELVWSYTYSDGHTDKWEFFRVQK